MHFNPYNLIKFYVGEITEPQTVSIYTDSSNSIPIQVSKGNKWYSCLLPKDKGLYQIVGDSVKNVVIKANISYSNTALSAAIISNSTVEASFKGSDTSNVTDMDYMFSDCNSLKSLDLSGWNTSNVTRMSSMFSNCSGLKSLDVSRFDTSNVTSMGSMFDGCSGLASLDVSNFNTSKVTDMGGMFYGCDGLISLNLSKWDISEGTTITNMFSGCNALKTITMIGCKQPTIDKIKERLTADGISLNNVNFVTE